VAAASMIGIALTTLSSSASDIFNNLVNNIGVLVAFYYGITGLACAWAFRRTWGQGLRANLTMIVAPLLGGIGLLYVCWVVIQEGGRTAIPDDVALLSSIPAVIITYYVTRGRTTFFRQPLVAYDSVED
jgi:L-asparagine transporter-like permease